jgi:peptidoglycan/LPS O-acetylase OafA/YrhL
MVVLVVYFVTQGRARRVQAQVEMQSRLIDRFGSAPELVQFLHSPAGREFVAGVQGAPAALTRERLMSGFTRSIVLTSLGCAFVYLNVMWEDDFAIPAAILLFLGIGYMIATFVSYKLSAKLMGDMHREA